MDYVICTRNKLPRNKFGYVNNEAVAKTTIFSKNATGNTSGKAGQEALNIYTDKSGVVFNADSSGVIKAGQSDTIYVHAYKGLDRIDTSVGNITGAIAGKLNVVVNNNGDSSTTITVSPTTALDSSDGEITYSVYVNTDNPRSLDGTKDASYWDPSTYTLAHVDFTYYWRTVTDGKKGNDGSRGADGSKGDKGDKGDQGLKGAVCRGPFKWVDESSANNRWFYDGSVHIDIADSSKYLDLVITEDGSIYYCNNSIETDDSDLWSDVSSNFTKSTNFDFVATNLVLAQNAKIDFLTNNELYLIDSSGNITGGAKGGNSVNFWAGGSVPADASFKVNNDGEMTAEKGTFGCMTIGDDSQFGDSLIATEYLARYGNLTTIVSSKGIKLDCDDTGVEQGYKSTIYLASTASALEDRNAPVEIEVYDDKNLAMETNGIVRAGEYDQNNSYRSSSRAGLSIFDYKYAFTTAFKNMNLIFLTTTVPTITVVDGYTYANGICIGTSFYGSTSVQRLTSSNYATFGFDSKYIGHYIVYVNSYGKLTGFANPNYVTKQSDTIYLTI